MQDFTTTLRVRPIGVRKTHQLSPLQHTLTWTREYVAACGSSISCRKLFSPSAVSELIYCIVNFCLFIILATDGDTTPKNSKERIWTVFMTVIGQMLYACTLANMSSLVYNLDVANTM